MLGLNGRSGIRIKEREYNEELHGKVKIRKLTAKERKKYVKYTGNKEKVSTVYAVGGADYVF